MYFLSLNEVVFCERGHLTLATPVSCTVQGFECNISIRRAWRWLVRVEIFSITVYIVINCIKEITCAVEQQTLLQCQCDKTAVLSKYIGTLSVCSHAWKMTVSITMLNFQQNEITRNLCSDTRWEAQLTICHMHNAVVPLYCLRSLPSDVNHMLLQYTGCPEKNCSLSKWYLKQMRQY